MTLNLGVFRLCIYDKASGRLKRDSGEGSFGDAIGDNFFVTSKLFRWHAVSVVKIAIRFWQPKKMNIRIFISAQVFWTNLTSEYIQNYQLEHFKTNRRSATFYNLIHRWSLRIESSLIWQTKKLLKSLNRNRKIFKKHVDISIFGNYSNLWAFTSWKACFR